MARKWVLTAIFATLIAGCESDSGGVGSVTQAVSKKVSNVKSLMASQPAPKLQYSLEREILSKRIERWNDPNKMLYLYIFTPTNIVYYVTVKGKLASTSKRLTPPWMLVDCDKGEFSGECVVEAPDEMGVWGKSAPAKVGIMTNGGLIEIGGFTGYILTETPLTFEREVKLVEIRTKK